MKKNNVLMSKPSNREELIKERDVLKGAILEEIDALEYGNSSEVICSVEGLREALFVIDKAFEDLIAESRTGDFFEIEIKVKDFKESLIYAIYGI